VHRDFFGKNPRLALLTKTFDKMPKEKQQQLINAADDFLNLLGTNTPEGVSQTLF